MKKYILILALAFLLVLPMINARLLESIEPVDWRTETLTIREAGVYKGEDLITSSDKAEIWIDRKVDNIYYIDSLVNEDTKVNIELFYEVQPDEITYRSHNGKYEQTFTYNGWTWRENCTEECFGGWVTIPNIYLEYATGSNTFTSAISGATWMNDGINNTLTQDTDYTQSGSTFTIKNIDYAWGEIEVNYNYASEVDRGNKSSSTVLNLTSIFIGISLITLLWLFIKYKLEL